MIRAVIEKETASLDTNRIGDDPDASIVAVLLLHHITDFQEAISKGNEGAAQVSRGDIIAIMNELGSRDLDRIEIVFNDDYRYNQFVKELHQIISYRL